MTWYSSKDVAYVLLGDYSIGPRINALRLKVTAVLTDTTAFGSTWQSWTDTGLRNGELEMSGFYDGAAPYIHMNTVSGTDRVVSVFLEGDVVSKRYYLFQKAIVSAAEIGISSDSVHTSSPTITVRGEVNHGYIVAPYALRTTAANTDLTYATLAADAATAHCHLHVAALTLGGYTNCIVTLRDSNDHITFADAQAFAAVTAIGDWIVDTTTLEQYLSVAWAWTGAGTGQSIGFTVGVAVD